MQRIDRTTLLVFAGIFAISLILAGCGKKNSTPPPAAGPPEVAVITVQPQRVTLTTELSGRTAPCQVAEVRPQVTGIIKKRLFTEGAEVKAGQVLFQIDPASYQATLASAKALLARAEANLTPARLKAARYQELLESRAISPQDHDDAQAAVKQAEAEVASAQAAVENAVIAVQYTAITAPISGRIGRSAVTAGALVTANQATALATIQQLDPIFVDVTRSSSELLQLKRQLAAGTLQTDATGGARVKLLLEDNTPYSMPGTLKFSEVSVDPGTGSVILRTLFPNPDQLLLPGMFVRAILEEGSGDGALLVPQRGVTRNPAGKPMVFVVGGEEKVEARPIKATRTIGDSWLVEEGLKPGDRVILEGIQRARPGTVVKTVPFGAPPVVPAAAEVKK